MGTDTDVLSRAVLAISEALRPLREAIAEPNGVEDVLDAIGVNPTDDLRAEELDTLQQKLSDAFTALDSFTDPGEVLGALGDFAAAFSGGLPPSLSDTAAKVIDALIVNLLQRKVPRVAATLLFLGLIELERLPDSRLSGRPRSRWVVHWDRVTTFFEDPRQVFALAYGWGSDLDAALLLHNLRALLMFVGVPAAFEWANDTDVGVLSAVDFPVLRVPLLVYAADSSLFEVGVALLPTRADDDSRFDGVVIGPFGKADLSADVELGNGWTFQSKVKSSATGGFGLFVKDDGGVAVGTIGGSSGSSASVDISMGAEKHSAAGPVILFGGSKSSRLEASAVGVSSKASGSVANTFEVGIEVSVKTGRLVISPSGSDSFVSSILPPEGIQAPFELVIGWSTLRGVYFRGSAGLEIAIPIHLSAGPIDVPTLRLNASLATAPPALSLGLAIDASANIGPIAASVTRVGVEVDVGISRTPDIATGFLAPQGVGLAIAGSGLSGGGFLSHDEALARYAGILDLNFGEIGLVAVALITTKLPGGKKGYALFINIGVTFSPAITLPYNFNLQGCGGLLALNRSMDVEALRSGLKTRTLDSILFPEDPILNAAKIINDSERVFPIEEGRFVVGPMAKLGWGANGLILADIAIVIELPSPVIIAVLGQITAAFPQPDEAKVILHLDVLGVLDIGKKSFALDATLYDSKIIKYDLSGDMALRLNWGDHPQFAMSLGGFHPRFDPPPGFPSLRRLKLQLSSSKSFDLSCTVYQALTSNTLQMGAKLQLHAEACGVDVDGHLSMDTLICWSPFEFEVDIDGSVSARYRGHNIASVHLGIGLSGPTPWHAKGKAKVSVLCWDVTARFEKKWGSDERASLPKVDPREPFLAEVRNVANWSGALLPRRHAVESLKSLEISQSDPPVEPPLIVHPAGMLEVRQRLLPLGLKLELFANSEVTGHSTFDVELHLGAPEADHGTAASEASSSGAESAEPPPQPPVQTDDAKEHFARGQFKALSKSDRLSKPSYEKFKAGERAGPSEARLDGEPVPCDLEFESIVIRSNRASDPPRVAVNPKWSTLRRTIGVPALRRASLRHQRRGKFASAGGPRIDALDEGYVIVDRLTLLRATGLLSSSAAPLTMTEAEDLVADAISTHQVAAGSVLVVPSFEEEFA